MKGIILAEKQTTINSLSLMEIRLQAIEVIVFPEKIDTSNEKNFATLKRNLIGL